MVIWQTARNRQQGQLIADFYRQPSLDMPHDQEAVITGGLPGYYTDAILTDAGLNPANYMLVSVDAILGAMAAKNMIPAISGQSPLAGAKLVHAEAQYLLKRIAMLALFAGRNLVMAITIASPIPVSSWLRAAHQAGYSVSTICQEITADESVRRCEARHQSGEGDYRDGRGYGGRSIHPDAIHALARAAPPSAVLTTALESSGIYRAAFSNVSHTIDRYVDGEIGIEELCASFRARNWATVPAVCPPGLEDATEAIDDPEPRVPGSFDDVAHAYDLGMLDDDDYDMVTKAILAGRHAGPRAD